MNTHHITISPAIGTYVVRAGGAVLGETTRAIQLIEGDYPPAIYFPPADLALPFLEPSESIGHNPIIGTVNYVSIQTKSVLIKDAGWTFVNPSAAYADIKDYISFHPAMVVIERI